MLRALVVMVLLARVAHANPELGPLIEPVPPCEAARATCLGIRLHVPIDDDGPIATAAWIADQLREANKHFAPLEVGFQIVGVAPLPASVTRVEDRAERSALGARLDRSAIDVFLTGHLDDVDTAGAMAWGVTWRTGGRKFVIVSTQAWPRTLAHELGHVFGLPHSEYAISIMNKTVRIEPPVDQRTFHADELAKLKARVRQLVRRKVFGNLAAKRR